MCLPPYSTYFTQCFEHPMIIFPSSFQINYYPGVSTKWWFSDSIIPSIITSWHSSTKKTFLRIPATCLFLKKKKKKFYGLVFIIFNSMCLTHYPLFIGMLRFSPNLARGSSFLCPFDVISTDYVLAFWHKRCLWILVFSLTQTCNKNTSSRSSVCFL